MAPIFEAAANVISWCRGGDSGEADQPGDHRRLHRERIGNGYQQVLDENKRKNINRQTDSKEMDCLLEFDEKIERPYNSRRAIFYILCIWSEPPT